MIVVYGLLILFSATAAVQDLLFFLQLKTRQNPCEVAPEQALFPEVGGLPCICFSVVRDTSCLRTNSKKTAEGTPVYDSLYSL